MTSVYKPLKMILLVYFVCTCICMVMYCHNSSGEVKGQLLWSPLSLCLVGSVNSVHHVW